MFSGFDIMKNQEVTIKMLNHNTKNKVNREIMSLNLIKNMDVHPNLANLIDYGIDRLDGTVVMVYLLIF